MISFTTSFQPTEAPNRNTTPMPLYSADSPRLWLQPLNLADHLQDYFEIMSSPDSMLWSRSAPHTSLEETRRLMLDSLPTPEKPWNKRWTIVLKPPSRHPPLPTTPISELQPESESEPKSESEREIPIPDGSEVEMEKEKGKAKMIGIIGTPRKGELAYKVHPAYWGKGYMSEALSMFLDMFWGDGEDKPLTRLTAGADPENIGSIRVLEKAGFTKGEYVKDFHVRGVNDGSGVMSDMQFFVLERPPVR